MPFQGDERRCGEANIRCVESRIRIATGTHLNHPLSTLATRIECRIGDFPSGKGSYNIPMEPLVIAGKAFQSRLIVGTGKYKDGRETQAAIEASGAEMVTVAVRRVNLDRSKESLLDFIDPQRYFLLPNTAGCYTADEAIRAARLGREVGLSDWVKIEVIGDQATLYPDIQATLEATRVLVKEGFTVLPYTSDDIVFARRLIDVGAAAVMPLGAPIGSGLGIQNTANLQILRERITEVPLIVDAGVGTASDAAIAMELGADAVLMNTGIAAAQKPVLMAEAMCHAVLAGRQAYVAGRMPRSFMRRRVRRWRGFRSRLFEENGAQSG